MRTRTLAVLALLTAARTAAADDPKFVYAAPDAPDPKKAPPDPNAVEWNATAEAGLVFITGNADSTSVGGGVHASRKQGLNKLAIDGTAAYVKTGLLTLNDKNGNGVVDNTGELQDVDSVTAETLLGKLRYDRFLDEEQSLYVAAIGARDVPAGKDYALGGQIGYSRRLTKTKTSETVAEVGYDYTGEKDIAPPPMMDPALLSIHSLRAFVGYKGEMVPGTNLAISLEGLTNLNHETLATGEDGGAFNDTRVNGRAAISTKIGKGLAIETSIESHFDNRPAPLQVKGVMFAPGFVPAAEKLDTIMKFQLIYAFF
jgi:hypothetical protein